MSKKQLVGISRDHSSSMHSLRDAAARDYNLTVQAIKDGAGVNNIDTLVSVTEAGDGVRVVEKNKPVTRVATIGYYETRGMTPLFDSVGKLIDIFKAAPEYKDPDLTFLIIAITDGEENDSRSWKYRLGEEIKSLQKTDRWTFVFRVPKGYGRNLTSLGIPAGNIQEWETSERGLSQSSSQTVAAVSNYFSGVSRGIRATQSFYADLSKVTPQQVAANMKDLSDEVEIFPVKDRSEISSFFTRKTKKTYQKGTAFYQLTKPEKAVQDYKVILVRDKSTGAVYGGGAARQLLGLPDGGTIGLKPGDHGNYDIFIQSTSSNRVLFPGTSAVYWENA